MRKSRVYEEVLTVEEVAHRLRVDARTVRKWIRKGELVAFDVGREYRIRVSALHDFIQRREAKNKGHTAEPNT
jgi:excisionase family DNA binding protein